MQHIYIRIRGEHIILPYTFCNVCKHKFFIVPFLPNVLRLVLPKKFTKQGFFHYCEIIMELQDEMILLKFIWTIPGNNPISYVNLVINESL